MNKKIAKNYIFNTAYQVLAIIAPLITAPYIARVLHTDGVGLYSFTLTIPTIFSLFAGLGFASYGQREIAYHQNDKALRSTVFFEIMVFRAILTLLVSVIYLSVAVIYSKYTYILLPQVFIVLATIFEMSWYFQGLEEFRIIVVRNAIVKIATIVLTFVLVRSEEDMYKYILLHSLSPFISNLIYCTVIKKYVQKVKITSLHPVRHLRGSLEFFLPLIAVQIYSYLDKLMLGFYMSTTDENGYYEEARKITQIIVTLVVSLNTVMMSRIANLFANKQKEQIKHYYSKSFSIILMLLFPISAGLFLVSDSFTIWYFGEDFLKVGFLLKLCSILIPLMCIGNFVGIQYLSPTGLQNKMTLSYVIAAIVNILMNVLLIPQLYSVGALVASIIAEAVSCFIQLGYLLKSEYKFSLPKGVWKYLLASVIMILVIVFEHYLFKLEPFYSFLLDVVLGGIIYVTVLMIFKDENLRYLKDFILHKTQKQ